MLSIVLIPNVTNDANKKTSSTHQIIMQAIQRGVPMYNSGHHAQTAAIYMQAGNDILDQCPYSTCSSASDTIKTAMSQASSRTVHLLRLGSSPCFRQGFNFGKLISSHL